MTLTVSTWLKTSFFKIAFVSFSIFGLGMVLSIMSQPQAYAGKYAEPSYTIVKTFKNQCEIRRYEPMTLLATSILTENTSKPEENRAFGRLFRYIAGNNHTDTKIEMTIPVLQYTHPAMHPGDDTKASHEHMAFILPTSYKASSAPKPLDKGIVIVDRPVQTFAVCRFSGSSRSTAMTKHAQTLEALIQQHKLTPTHPDMKPLYAFYNNPLTLPWMKRNEVWVRINDLPTHK